MRLLPLVLLAACGDISNAWILEDAAFIDALPTESRHTVALDVATAAKGVEDAPSLLQLSYGVATDVNGTILQVLRTIDEVRALRPDERTEDGRRWGPYAWQEGVDVAVWVDRAGAGRFDWGVEVLTADATVPYITGTHYAGDTVAAGDGVFTWTFDDVAALVDGGARGTVEVDYDNREGIDLLVAIDGVTDGSTAPVTADYAFRLVAGEGDFQYATTADLGDTPDGSPEDVRVRTRWYQGGGGRADAVITGGTLGGLVEQWTQCWDPTLALTYEHDEFGLVTPSGDEGACVFPAFAEVDRI